MKHNNSYLSKLSNFGYGNFLFCHSFRSAKSRITIMIIIFICFRESCFEVLCENMCSFWKCRNTFSIINEWEHYIELTMTTCMMMIIMMVMMMRKCFIMFVYSHSLSRSLSLIIIIIFELMYLNHSKWQGCLHCVLTICGLRVWVCVQCC